MPQWKATQQRIYGQHKLDLMSFDLKKKKKKGTHKMGWVGKDGSGGVVRDD